MSKLEDMGLGDILDGLSGDLIGEPPEDKSLLRRPFGKSITKLAHEYLGSLAAKKDYRSPGFHASSMYSVCERQLALQAMTGKESHLYIDADLRMKFLLGHQIHALLQDDILGPAGLIKGNWKCKGCGDRIYAKGALMTIPRDENGDIATCRVCNKDNRWMYVEPKVRIAVPGVPNEPEWNIVGACDGVMENSVLDVKTISPNGVNYLEDAWRSLKDITDWRYSDERLPWGKQSARKYYVQLQIYMFGLDKKSATVYYTPKDTLDDMRSWIEIPVEFNQKVIDDMFLKVQGAYATSIEIEKKESFKLPKRVCHTATCYKARDCAVLDECFSRKNE